MAEARASHAVSEPLRLRERLELLQRVVLDLADSLPRHTEGLSDLLERARLRAVEPVAQLDDPALPVGKRRQRELDVLAAQRQRRGVERRLGRLVGDEVAER